MTTLTVYFASSPTSLSSSSKKTTATTTISSSTTIAGIPAIRTIQNLTKSIPSPTTPSITLQTSTSSTQTPLSSRVSSKRTKTFFERFNQTSPSTLLSNPQSPPSHHQHHQQQQSTDSSNPSIDPPTRLRRRFTFRRSLRHSIHNKGGDIDDGISFDVDGSSPHGVINSHHNTSSTTSHNQQHGSTNTTNKTTTASGMHRRESFLYKYDSDNDLSPKCISRNPSIGSEL